MSNDFSRVFGTPRTQTGILELKTATRYPAARLVVTVLN